MDQYAFFRNGGGKRVRGRIFRRCALCGAPGCGRDFLCQDFRQRGFSSARTRIFGTFDVSVLSCRFRRGRSACVCGGGRVRLVRGRAVSRDHDRFGRKPAAHGRQDAGVSRRRGGHGGCGSACRRRRLVGKRGVRRGVPYFVCGAFVLCTCGGGHGPAQAAPAPLSP